MNSPTDVRARHWDATYRRREIDQLSWFQATPAMSLNLIDALNIALDIGVIDIGGGASTFVDHLLERGFTDISVLDVSEASLAAGKQRIGHEISVHWLREDLLDWHPIRRFGLWHDRAVFHFLVEASERDAYIATLRSAIDRGGSVILGTFAPDGPDHCSGLPVARYSPDDLVALLGSGFEVVSTDREQHITPSGVQQSFTWIAARANN